MVLISGRSSDVSEFALFDTSVPRGHPVIPRRFRAPPRYHDWFPAVFLDVNRCSGILDQDGPFATDPTQAVFVMKLVSRQGPRVLLVVRIQSLIDHLRSPSTEACVPWHEWGRGTVVMAIPPRDGSHSGSYPLVHGAHMVVVKRSTTPGIGGCHHNLCIFDFSRRGLSLLPPCYDNDGVGRWAAYEDGQNFLFQGNGEMDEWGFNSLGNGRFMYLVSCPHRQKGRNADFPLRTVPLVLGAYCTFGSWYEGSLSVLPQVARIRHCTKN